MGMASVLSAALAAASHSACQKRKINVFQWNGILIDTSCACKLTHYEEMLVEGERCAGFQHTTSLAKCNIYSFSDRNHVSNNYSWIGPY